MTCDAFIKLKKQSDLFREWAQTYPALHAAGLTFYGGEWECDYLKWGEIYSAFSRFLKECPFALWNEEVIETILYLVARDNEDEILSDEIAEHPERLLFLARAGSHTAEHDAKWQIATGLGNLPEYARESEPVLLHWAEDENEYVRRRALKALGRLKSPAVERLVEQAWNREDSAQEYQRMTALYALYDSESPLLETYLREAEADGRPYLVAYAAKIRDGKPD